MHLSLWEEGAIDRLPVKARVFISVALTCAVSQRGGGGAATERGLDQHRRQQGLLPPPPGRVEGR